MGEREIARMRGLLPNARGIQVGARVDMVGGLFLYGQGWEGKRSGDGTRQTRKERKLYVKRIYTVTENFLQRAVTRTYLCKRISSTRPLESGAVSSKCMGREYETEWGFIFRNSLVKYVRGKRM